MNLFKSFTLKWWQAGIFKIGMISFGIALGATWSAFFIQWVILFWTVFILTAGYLSYIWWKQ